MDTRDRKQTGHIYRRGNWWVLRYRVEVCEGGKLHVVQRAKRLAPVGADHKTKASVRHLAVVALEPVNNERLSAAAVTTLGDFVSRVYLPHASDQKRASTQLAKKSTRRFATTAGGNQLQVPPALSVQSPQFGCEVRLGLPSAVSFSPATSCASNFCTASLMSLWVTMA